jgi:hypothetical protein
LYVLNEIKRQLRENYEIDIDEASFVRATYDSELKRFAKGIYGELRESKPDEYHQKEMSELARLASNTSEHETFNRSQKLGALTGYHANAFTISPPRIDQVIFKRLRFALKITQGRIPVARLHNVGIKLENLTRIIEILLQSLQRDARLFEFLDNISGGNVRSALEMLTTFIGSGHADTRKMLDRDGRYGRYLIPPHEIIRAVIYGDCIHYDPSRSVITNVFDISTRDGREHFLLALAIGTLDHSASTSGVEGFVPTDFLYETLQRMGFTPDQIDFAVARGIDKGLIETSGRQIPRRGDEMPYITHCG